MEYTKMVNVGPTGMVTTWVHAECGRCVGMEFFKQVFSTNKAVKRSVKKAHIWADERIKICQEGEE